MLSERSGDDTSQRTRWSPELLIVLACVVTLVLVSLPARLGIQLAALVIAASFLVGLIAGIGYHIALYRALAPMPKRWWWSPTHAHVRLCDAQRRRVIPWFVVGASGFCGSILGAAAFLSAALRL